MLHLVLMSQGVLEGWYSKQRREEEEAAAQGEPCAGVEGEQPPACLIEAAGWILSPRGTSPTVQALGSTCGLQCGQRVAGGCCCHAFCQALNPPPEYCSQRRRRRHGKRPLLGTTPRQHCWPNCKPACQPGQRQQASSHLSRRGSLSSSRGARQRLSRRKSSQRASSSMPERSKAVSSRKRRRCQPSLGGECGDAIDAAS